MAQSGVVYGSGGPGLNHDQRMLSQEERISRFWGVDVDGLVAKTIQEIDSELAQVSSSPLEVVRVLCRWVREGYVELVVEALESLPRLDGSNEQAFKIMLASLLMKLGKQKDVTEIVETLQQSKAVAAKVLCAIVTFEWNERATAVDMLYKILNGLTKATREPMLDVFGQVLDDSGKRRWELRILALLTACYVATGNYSLAIQVSNGALERYQGNEEAKASILLQQARLRLQIGDSETARYICEQLGTKFASLPERIKVSSLLLDGLIDYAESNYQQALKKFESLNKQYGSMEKEVKFNEDNLLDGVFEVYCPFHVTLANNMALCHLYCSNLTHAIQVLESCIRANPRQNMAKSIVFNLCTLYDLAKSKENSTVAKQDLERLAHVHSILGRFDRATDLRL